VTAVDPVARSIRVSLTRREVELTSRYLGDEAIHHGYAMTAHRLQGATVDRAHVLGSDELYREWGYTAMSRHRDSAHFYVTTRQPQAPLPGMDQYDDITHEVVSPLRNERAKNLAIESSPLTADIPVALDPDTADGMLRSMPAQMRGLPAAIRRQQDAVRELAVVRKRIEAAHAELDHRRLRRQTRRDIERRLAGDHAAADHWTSQAHLAELAVAQAQAVATEWLTCRQGDIDRLDLRHAGIPTHDGCAPLIDTLARVAATRLPAAELPRPAPDNAPDIGIEP
jgi:hypothetical protein